MSMKNKILIVDDQIAVTELLETLFSEQNFVRTAQSGEEGLTILIEESFDLIISDINMRPMNGIEFGYEVRKLHLLTPIIFFSGEVNGEITYQNDILRIGNSQFVEKSFEKLRKIASMR